MCNQHFKVEFSIEGYKLLTTNCSAGRKGGKIIIFINNNLRSAIKSEMKTNQFTETMWEEITHGNESLDLGAMRPQIYSLSFTIICDAMA